MRFNTGIAAMMEFVNAAVRLCFCSRWQKPPHGADCSNAFGPQSECLCYCRNCASVTAGVEPLRAAAHLT